MTYWNTMKPRYSAPAYNEIPPIEHNNFGPQKYFYSYLFISHLENLSIEYGLYKCL